MADSLDNRKARAFDTIFYGGLIVGVLDILDAMIFFGLRNHLTPVQILQSVAAGLVGRPAAAAGGAKTAALGLLLHFLIATIWATIFFLLSRLLPLLLRYAVVAGLLYGVCVHFLMSYVVVPLSAIGPRPTAPLAVLLNGVIGHALLVGLPIALVARRSARK